MRTFWIALVGALAVISPTTTASASGPDGAALAHWFTEEAPSQVIGALSGDGEWLATLRGDGPGKLSFGDPVPVVGIRPPAFDLKRGVLESSKTLDESLDRSSSEYGARALVDGSPAPLIAFATVAADGQVGLTGVSEVRFLDDSSAVLPQAGIAETQSGWVGFTSGPDQRVVALDAASKAWIGGESVDRETFLTAVAKRKAEYDAVARIAGPVAGGQMPLFEVDESWQAQVARGLAIPDDQAWTPERQAARESAAAASGASSAWPLAAVIIALVVLAVAGVVIVAVVRRRAQHQSEPSLTRRL